VVDGQVVETFQRPREPDVPEMRAMLHVLQTMVLESYESVSLLEREGAVHILREQPESCAYLLDDYFSRLVVGRVPDMVRRTMRFDPIAATTPPAPAVNVCLREAVRSFLFGLFQAAVALARAALERALRERIPYASVNNWQLEDLIRAAATFRALEPSAVQFATDVRLAGNTVLHGEQCSETLAFDVLVKARGVLEALYDSQP
jgi:hypothetical protein